MRRTLRGLTLPLLLVACARPTVGTTTIKAPAAPEPTAVSEAQPWAVVYERECLGSNTSPFVSPGQKLVGFCENAYSFDEGTIVGAVPVGGAAFLGEAQILGGSYGGRGLEVVPLVGDGIKDVGSGTDQP